MDLLLAVFSRISKGTAGASSSKEANYMFATWSLLGFTQQSFAAPRIRYMIELGRFRHQNLYQSLG